MKKETIEWLAALRARAEEPGIIFVAVRAHSRSIFIYPEEITERTDEQLLTFIRRRLANAAKSSNPEPEHVER